MTKPSPTPNSADNEPTINPVPSIAGAAVTRRGVLSGQHHQRLSWGGRKPRRCGPLEIDVVASPVPNSVCIERSASPGAPRVELAADRPVARDAGDVARAIGGEGGWNRARQADRHVGLAIGMGPFLSTARVPDDLPDNGRLPLDSFADIQGISRRMATPGCPPGGGPLRDYSFKVVAVPDRLLSRPGAGRPAASDGVTRAGLKAVEVVYLNPGVHPQVAANLAK